MPRKRTGTIIAKPSGLFARLWVKLEDGTEERRWINLETKDRARATRVLAKLVAEIEAGRFVADAKEVVTAPELAGAAFDEWLEERRARGVAMVQTEEGYWKHHLSEHLATMPLADIRKVHCSRALAAGRAKGLARETVAHLRRLLVRFFNALEADERITVNPMRGVAMPEMKSDKRPRTPLLDAEYSALMAAPVDFTPTKKTGKPSTRELEFFEMKVISFTARTLGGHRAAEGLRLDWSTIDRGDFLACTLARAKTGEIQALEIPEMLRPFLRAWWTAHGCPDHGPVFPVTRGERKGEARAKTSGLAARFRRALQRALTWAGMQHRRELFHDTPTSKKTDFHTRRREYVSGLATSGVNEQTAMALAHHHDSKVHQRYQLAAIRSVPVGALPQLTTPANSVTLVTEARSVSGDSVVISGAGHQVRTGDIQLGKLTLYQLS